MCIFHRVLSATQLYRWIFAAIIRIVNSRGKYLTIPMTILTLRCAGCNHEYGSEPFHDSDTLSEPFISSHRRILASFGPLSASFLHGVCLGFLTRFLASGSRASHQSYRTRTFPVDKHRASCVKATVGDNLELYSIYCIQTRLSSIRSPPSSSEQFWVLLFSLWNFYSSLLFYCDTVSQYP